MLISGWQVYKVGPFEVRRIVFGGYTVSSLTKNQDGKYEKRVYREIQHKVYLNGERVETFLTKKTTLRWCKKQEEYKQWQRLQKQLRS